MKGYPTISRRQVISSVGIGTAVALAGCSGGSGDGPEAVLEGFFTATDSGDVAEANDYFLDEAGSDDRPVEQRSVNIRTIEDQPIEQVAETAPSITGGGSVSVDEIERFGDQLASEFGRGESEWTLVYFDVDIGGVGEENYAWLVETEDGWKIGLLALFGP